MRPPSRSFYRRLIGDYGKTAGPHKNRFQAGVEVRRSTLMGRAGMPILPSFSTTRCLGLRLAEIGADAAAVGQVLVSYKFSPRKKSPFLLS